METHPSRDPFGPAQGSSARLGGGGRFPSTSSGQALDSLRSLRNDNNKTKSPRHRKRAVATRSPAQIGLLRLCYHCPMSTKTLLTADDLWKKVADGSRYELSKGELLPMTPVGWRHGEIVIRLGRMLQQHAEENSLGGVGTEVGFRLARDPDTVRAPDIAFVARNRMPQGAAAERFAELAPDLAVEVLSPEDTASEIQRKVEEYLAAGARLVWIVDPSNQRVTTYRSLQDIKILSVEQQLDGGDILPGFTVQIAQIFADKSAQRG